MYQHKVDVVKQEMARLNIDILGISKLKYTGHRKHPFSITQEMNLHGHHQIVNNEIRLIIFLCSQRWRSSMQVQVAQSRPPDSLGLPGLYSPWNSPGQNTGEALYN